MIDRERLDQETGLTRRTAIAAGVATLTVGPVLMAPAPAAAARPQALRRSAWTGLVGRPVTVDGVHVFDVLAVDDLAFAGTREIVGSPFAFAVTFAGPPGLAPDGPVSIAHPGLGPIDVFVAPVGAAGDRYELVVDRSVGLAGVDPPKARVPKPAAPAAVDLGGLSAPERVEVLRFAFLRSARVRRGRAELRLRKTARIRAVRVRLLRRGRVVGRGHARVTGSAVDVRLRLRRPLRRGVYELVVTALDASGRRTTVRRSVYVRA